MVDTTMLDLAIWVPIPLAFFVLGLMVLLRGENRLRGMLGPFLLVVVGSILYIPLGLHLKGVLQPDADTEFLFRRTSESFSEWVLGVPILFAYGVLGLIALSRRERRFAGMLAPFLTVTILSIIYVPLAREGTAHSLIELEAAGVFVMPGQTPLTLNASWRCWRGRP